MNYWDFDIHDFAADEDFQHWVKEPTPATAQFWSSFLDEYPHKKEAVERAKKIILQLSDAEQRTVSEAVVKDIWQNIAQDIDSSEPADESQQPSRTWLWVTLVLMGLLGGGYFIWKKAHNTEGGKKTETTTEQKAIADVEWQVIKNTNEKAITVKLDDGSTISLEKNSQVNYPQRFVGEKREVYLTGEAFFEVEKNPLKPFLVYANGIVTKVLGTSFRIKAYKNEPQVVVSVRTGKVSVYEKSVFDAAILRGGQGEVAGMVVTPNQKVVFDHETVQLKKGIVEQPQPIVAATADKHDLEFEDAPASVVLKKLSERYGIPIQFDEAQFAKCPLTLTLTDETLSESLKVICLAIRAYTEEIDGQIVVTGKGCR